MLAVGLEGTKEIDFLGRRVLVPVNAEQVVEHVYGAGWRIPSARLRLAARTDQARERR